MKNVYVQISLYEEDGVPHTWAHASMHAIRAQAATAWVDELFWSSCRK